MPISANGVFLPPGVRPLAVSPEEAAWFRRGQTLRPLFPRVRVEKVVCCSAPSLLKAGRLAREVVAHHCDPDHPRCALVGDPRCLWHINLAQSALA